MGPGGEYAGVHVGAKLRTKRRGEYTLARRPAAESRRRTEGQSAEGRRAPDVCPTQKRRGVPTGRQATVREMTDPAARLRKAELVMRITCTGSGVPPADGCNADSFGEVEGVDDAALFSQEAIAELVKVGALQHNRSPRGCHGERWRATAPAGRTSSASVPSGQARQPRRTCTPHATTRRRAPAEQTRPEKSVECRCGPRQSDTHVSNSTSLPGRTRRATNTVTGPSVSPGALIPRRRRSTELG